MRDRISLCASDCVSTLSVLGGDGNLTCAGSIRNCNQVARGRSAGVVPRKEGRFCPSWLSVA